MRPIIGDRVAVQSTKTTTAARTGTIEVVLAERPPRYQVRWDDGRWSIIAPTDGVMRVISPRARSKRPPRRGATAAAGKNSTAD